MFEVRNLSAGYGRIQILRNVSFTLQEGERVALVGANGAGKTTFIRCLSGQLSAQGQQLLRGQSILGMDPSRRVSAGICQVPEGRKLFPGLTCAENLRMGAYHLRLTASQEDRRIEEVLSHLPDLKPKLRQLAGTMSGGEQQMCAIARGLMAEPKILMVDEMSLGLAPVIVDRLVEALLHINRECGVTLLIVEQDVSLALELCERGYVLETGEIRLEGSSSDLLQNDGVREAYLGL